MVCLRPHPSWWHLLPSGQHVFKKKPLGSGVSGIGQSPSKRRRLSDGLDDGDEPDVISLSVCSRHRDEEQEGDVFVSLVFCWSKTIVLYDAEMLFEVRRFCPEQGVELRCAAAVSLPASLLTCSRHEDGLALEKESVDARATLPAGMCSSS